MKFFFFLTSFRSENSRELGGISNRGKFSGGKLAVCWNFFLKIRAQLEFFVLKTRAMKKTWHSGYLLILL